MYEIVRQFGIGINKNVGKVGRHNVLNGGYSVMRRPGPLFFSDFIFLRRKENPESENPRVRKMNSRETKRWLWKSHFYV
jgi:hypothetical protein